MRARILANDGGPLAAADAADARYWRGLKPDDGSDYARACDCGYPASLIGLGSNSAVVIGAKEGIATAWWMSSADGLLYLIGCAFADPGTEAQLQRLLAEQASWTPLGSIVVPSDTLLLFHAASPGADLEIDGDRQIAHIGGALSTTVEPGTYALAACEIALPDRALFNVVRWMRA